MLLNVSLFGQLLTSDIFLALLPLGAITLLKWFVGNPKSMFLKIFRRNSYDFTR